MFCTGVAIVHLQTAVSNCRDSFLCFFYMWQNSSNELLQLQSGCADLSKGRRFQIFAVLEYSGVFTQCRSSRSNGPRETNVTVHESGNVYEGTFKPLRVHYFATRKEDNIQADCQPPREWMSQETEASGQIPKGVELKRLSQSSDR